MSVNISKCKELLKHCHLGNIEKVIELLARDDVDVNYTAKVTRSTVYDKNAITHAAAAGHEDIVKLLLENGANANCHYAYIKSPLHQAIENGHTQAALAIIHHGNLNFHEVHRGVYGFDTTVGIVVKHALKTKLFDVALDMLQSGMCAAPANLERNHSLYRDLISDFFKYGDVSILKELMANHKSAWENGWHAPFAICLYSSPEVVEAFIGAGGRFDRVAELFSRGLLQITRKDPGDTLSVRKIFLEKMCDVSLHDICWIFARKKWEDILGLLDNDGDINIRGALGITPLMIAAQFGDEVLVGRMIKAGADITAINDFGGTALTMAARGGNEKVMEKLLLVSNLALFSDAVVNNDVETVREFVNLRQIDVNHADENGKNALMHACDAENLEMAEVVLSDTLWTFDLFNRYENFAPAEICADINAKDENGNTALANSCINGKNAAVRFLLKNGADVNCKNNDGDSVLALSCKSRNIDAAKLILLNGAHINDQNAEGNTALMISCANKDAGMVHLLMSGIQRTIVTIGNHGKVKYHYANLLDVDIKNKLGQTALMLSYMGESNPDIVNAVMSADPEDTGPFDTHGRRIHCYGSVFDAENDYGYDDMSAGIKKQRTALPRKDHDDEMQAIDEQEEVQLPPLEDFMTSHADGGLYAVSNADAEQLSFASPSFGYLL